MKQESWRHYPVGNKVDLVERLLDRGVATAGHRADLARRITRSRQPGQCCDAGCPPPGGPVMGDVAAVAGTLPSRQAGNDKS
jgi:4-hydroxybutyryl-CoA dehydratase/vinylacetyl-CoA-Delta-isomerase